MNDLRKFARLALLVALLPASASAAVRSDAVLGRAGELYVVSAGTYEELFPGRRQTEKTHRVLALDTIRPGQLKDRQLVPTSEGPESESAASLLYEEDSGAIYVLWESRSSSTFSVLKLSSFDGRRWSEAIEVSGNPASTKTPPTLLVTRDRVQARPPEGGQAERRRTIEHLVWTESSSRGIETLYTPIIFVDGTYLGWNPVYKLNDFEPTSTPTAPGPDPNVEVLRSPAIEQGRDGRTVVVSFTSPGSRRFNVVQVNILPGELQQLADGLRSTIIDFGRGLDLAKPGGREPLVEKAEVFLVEAGSAFEPEMIASVAVRVRTVLRGEPSNDLILLSDKLRSAIIDLGARLGSRGGLRPESKLASTRRIDQVNSNPRSTNQSAEPGVLGHLFGFDLVSSRPAPAVGAGAIEVFLSPNGQHQLVSWSSGERVFYRESRDEGWSEIREVRLTDTATLDRAYEILALKAKSR